MRVNIYTNSDCDKKEARKWNLLVEDSTIQADEVTINCVTKTSSDWVGNTLVDSIWCEAVKLQLLHKHNKIEVIID